VPPASGPKMEAAGSSIIYQTSQHHIPEDHNLRLSLSTKEPGLYGNMTLLKNIFSLNENQCEITL
jgi:hypothetical protein